MSEAPNISAGRRPVFPAEEGFLLMTGKQMNRSG